MKIRSFITSLAGMLSLITLNPIDAHAACDANDRICNDAVNNRAARQKETDDATTRKYNNQNGTSQYSGPTGGVKNGTPYIGYQKSTK